LALAGSNQTKCRTRPAISLSTSTVTKTVDTYQTISIPNLSQPAEGTSKTTETSTVFVPTTVSEIRVMNNTNTEILWRTDTVNQVDVRTITAPPVTVNAPTTQTTTSTRTTTIPLPVSNTVTATANVDVLETSFYQVPGTARTVTSTAPASTKVVPVTFPTTVTTEAINLSTVTDKRTVYTTSSVPFTVAVSVEVTERPVVVLPTTQITTATSTITTVAVIPAISTQTKTDFKTVTASVTTTSTNYVPTTSTSTSTRVSTVTEAVYTLAATSTVSKPGTTSTSLLL